MRAALLDNHRLVLEDVADPAPGPDDLVLDVTACGICGSDLHSASAFDFGGFVMGHEFCGTVAAVGRRVTGWSEGDRAVGLSLRTCGTCDACRGGWPRRCAGAQMVGYEIPGAFAERVVVRSGDALHLPASFDSRLGALVEPLAVARRAVDRLDLRPGDDVLVLGGGPIGLTVLLWLQSLGAGTVTVSDPQAGRRARAEALGAVTIDPGIDPTGGGLRDAGPWDRVVECVGLPGLIGEACGATAVGGVAVVVGVCMSADTFQPFEPLSRELDLRFSFYYRWVDFTRTIEAIDTGTLDPTALVTDQVSLEQLPARFEALMAPNDDAKVLVVP